MSQVKKLNLLKHIPKKIPIISFVRHTKTILPCLPLYRYIYKKKVYLHFTYNHYKKNRRGSPLMTELTPANSITMDSRMVGRNRNLCRKWNTLFARPGKTATPFKLIIQFRNQARFRVFFKKVYILSKFHVPSFYGLVMKASV